MVPTIDSRLEKNVTGGSTACVPSPWLASAGSVTTTATPEGKAANEVEAPFGFDEAIVVEAVMFVRGVRCDTSRRKRPSAVSSERPLLGATVRDVPKCGLFPCENVI